MTDESIPVPLEFFGEILPLCRDLAELRATLLVVEQAGLRRSPLVPLDALLAPHLASRTMGMDAPEPAQQRLVRALERAVASGALLRVAAGNGELQSVSYGLGTAANRALAERSRRGDAEAARRLALPDGMASEVSRPNAFALYERHIGPLTPLLAERLRDAESSYPREWIEEAILQAVQYNRRTWRYVETLLARWESTGSPRGWFHQAR